MHAVRQRCLCIEQRSIGMKGNWKAAKDAGWIAKALKWKATCFCLDKTRSRCLLIDLTQSLAACSRTMTTP